MLLQLDQVSWQRHGFVLGPLSLSIAPGEKIAVVGDNGSGKTSLLRLITEHIARIGGCSWAWLPDSAPRENLLTVRELLSEHALLQCQDLNAAALDQLLQHYQLDSVAARPCARLSLGFRQRVALAMVLLNQPQLLLLDEPANGLDASQQHWLKSALQAEPQRAVMMVTHQLAAWQDVLTRAVVIRQGELIFDGPSHEALTVLAGVSL